MKIPNFSARKGQSLIEAIVAVFILTVGFLGITNLLSRSFYLSRTTSDQLTATYLAAEGVEIAKNLIDHDVYSGDGWGDCFGNGGDFRLDFTTDNCPPPRGVNSAMRYNPSTHTYGYTGTTVTKFRRLVRITVPNASEIVVNSIVSWSAGPGASQSINLEDHFYNWRPL